MFSSSASSAQLTRLATQYTSIWGGGMSRGMMTHGFGSGMQKGWCGLTRLDEVGRCTRYTQIWGLWDGNDT